MKREKSKKVLTIHTNRFGIPKETKKPIISEIKERMLHVKDKLLHPKKGQEAEYNS